MFCVVVYCVDVVYFEVCVCVVEFVCVFVEVEDLVVVFVGDVVIYVVVLLVEVVCLCCVVGECDVLCVICVVY